MDHEGKQRRKILEEEEYTSSLTHIVTRDFFPALPSLRRDTAILEARSRGDISQAVALRRLARGEDRERELEWKEEMEEDKEVQQHTSHDEHIIQVRKRPRKLKHESLTGFHARVTSEDNAEFEINQERERQERERTLGVVYAARADKAGRLLIESCANSNCDGSDAGTKKIATNNNARALLGDTPLGLSADLYDAPPSAGLRITNADNSHPTEKNNAGSNGIVGRNGLFFQPQHRSRSRSHQTNSHNSTKLLTPGAGGTFLALESCDAASNNDAAKEGESNVEATDMPPPPARKPASSLVPFQPSIDQRYQLVEYLPKESLKDIHPPATRFLYQDESRLLANKNSSCVSFARNHRGSIGSYLDAAASDTTDLDASPPPLNLERDAHRKARLSEHEEFVAMTPLIQPRGGGNGNRMQVEPEPIMTWGDVASTPMVLGSGTAINGRSASAADWEPTRPASSAISSGPTFDVVDRTNRETMARIAEKGLMDRAKIYRAAGSSGSSKRGKEKDDGSVRNSLSSKSMSAAPLDRAASLTPAARALLEASTAAYRQSSKKNSSSRSGRSASSSSRIFQAAPSSFACSTSAARRLHAGSANSFGSALRMSYSATPQSRDGSRRRKSSSFCSSSRQAEGGATPRYQSLR